MSRVALLIGVSRYAMGLDPLLDAQKDTAMMQRVLRQCQFQTVHLCDRSLQEMQETIEVFFQQRAPDDQIVFLFCGYTLQDTEGRLYFATPNTQLTAEGAIVKAQTIPASVVQEAMNNSPAKQQVMILDSYSCQTANQPAPAEGMGNISTHLEGKGRAILTAAELNQQYVTPTELDVLTYTRYLAEGIESGAADTNDDGVMSAADVHDYAVRKLQIAAPALKPQIYGSAETAQIPLFEVPIHDPRISYRKVLEAAAAAHAADIDDEPLLNSESLLNDTRYELGLTPQEASDVKLQVLRPQRDYRQRMEFYQERAIGMTRSQDVANPDVRAALKQLQRSLDLTDGNVAMLAIAPFLAVQQNEQAHYQKNLLHYQQVLLRSMQRQYPLREHDRTVLRRLQQALQLKDDDVQSVETQITNQATQLMGGTSAAPATSVASARTVIPTPTPTPTPTRAPSAVPASAADLSDAQRAVLNLLMNPERETQLTPTPPDATPIPTPTPTLPPPASPVQRQPRPLLQNQNSTSTVMDRFRRSAYNYQALIIPAILLAAIVGLLIAVLPSSNRLNWRLPWKKPVDRMAAQQLNTAGLRKAQQGYNKEAIDDYNKAIEQNPNDPTMYINRGIAYHKLGNTGAAIRDYDQAVKLSPNSASAHSNLSYAYYDRQNYDKALEEGNTAVAINGRLPQAHINLANARFKKGDYNGALRDYNQAIALRPPAAVVAGAFNNRGNVQFALGKTRDAVTDYNQAIRYKSDYADAYYNLGLAEQALGNRDAAVRYLQTAANLFQNQGNTKQQKEATDRATAIQQGQSQNASPLIAT